MYDVNELILHFKTFQSIKNAYVYGLFSHSLEVWINLRSFILIQLIFKNFIPLKYLVKNKTLALFRSYIIEARTFLIFYVGGEGVLSNLKRVDWVK